MLKRIALPILAAAAMFATAAAPKADAAVRFGVSIGAPAYVAPVPYYAPNEVPYAYQAGPVYRGHDRHERRAHEYRYERSRDSRDFRDFRR